REFCKGMIKRGYNQKIKIDCNMRFNSDLTQKDYDLMAKAGFRFLLYGLESANQKTLDRLNKNLRVEQITTGVRMAKKAGLCPHATVMVGYPWETKEDAIQTLELAKKFFCEGLIDSLQATVVIPYPGTPLFKECEENDWLKTKDWDRYDMKEPVMKTVMSNEEILGMVRSIYSAIWSPQFVVRKLKEGLTDWNTFKYYTALGWKFISKRIDFKKTGIN
ncbi:B12-binding domain-containing radical SAM protein, partial [Candidatus Shapirobacteria bacterium CG10_big_fil_rev_8_21_14_0_10_38_8]